MAVHIMRRTESALFLLATMLVFCFSVMSAAAEGGAPAEVEDAEGVSYTDRIVTAAWPGAGRPGLRNSCGFQRQCGTRRPRDRDRAPQHAGRRTDSDSLQRRDHEPWQPSSTASLHSDPRSGRRLIRQQPGTAGCNHSV